MVLYRVHAGPRAAIAAVLGLCFGALLWAAPATAAGTISVSPSTVPAGGSVAISGSIPATGPASCAPGDSAIVTSTAALFPPDGFGPTAARDAAGAFRVSYTIPASTPPGTYRLGVRCGGGNVGVSASLTVTAQVRPVLSWALRPGFARDIAFGARGNPAIDSMWIVGTNPVPGGYGLYSWIGTHWVPLPGGATSISVDPSEVAWATNSANQIWNGGDGAWKRQPGFATDIAVGANGSAWIVGTNPVPGGYGIYRWNDAGWVPRPGAALTISVDPSGNPWVINSGHQIWHWNGTGWRHYPGYANDISVGWNGSVWIVGTNKVPGGFGIYRWSGTSWLSQPGGAVKIAVDPSGSHPWVINSLSQIYSS